MLAPMTGLPLARVSNRRRGHWSRNRGCCIDAGSLNALSARWTCAARAAGQAQGASNLVASTIGEQDERPRSANRCGGTPAISRHRRLSCVAPPQTANAVFGRVPELLPVASVGARDARIDRTPFLRSQSPPAVVNQSLCNTGLHSVEFPIRIPSTFRIPWVRASAL